MGDFNFMMGKRQVQKPHILNVRKFWNSGNCNSTENRSSKGKSCKAEANKHKDIYETNNLEIRTGKFETDTGGKFILLILRR